VRPHRRCWLRSGAHCVFHKVNRLRSLTLGFGQDREAIPPRKVTRPFRRSHGSSGNRNYKRLHLSDGHSGGGSASRPATAGKHRLQGLLGSGLCLIPLGKKPAAHAWVVADCDHRRSRSGRRSRLSRDDQPRNAARKGLCQARSRERRLGAGEQEEGWKNRCGRRVSANPCRLREAGSCSTTSLHSGAQGRLSTPENDSQASHSAAPEIQNSLAICASTSRHLWFAQ